MLAFLLITIVFLIAVSIYYYLIKYRVKQKHLLPFHVTNNKLTMKIKISNKFKAIDIKNTHTTYLMMLLMQKVLIQIKLKQMESHTKILSFTTLHM